MFNWGYYLHATWTFKSFVCYKVLGASYRCNKHTSYFKNKYAKYRESKKKKNQAKLTGKFFEAHIPHQFKYQVLNMTEF